MTRFPSLSSVRSSARAPVCVCLHCETVIYVVLLSIGRICGRGLPPLCTLAHGSCRVGLRSALGMRGIGRACYGTGRCSDPAACASWGAGQLCQHVRSVVAVSTIRARRGSTARAVAGAVPLCIAPACLPGPHTGAVACVKLIYVLSGRCGLPRCSAASVAIVPAITM